MPPSVRRFWVYRTGPGSVHRIKIAIKRKNGLVITNSSEATMISTIRFTNFWSQARPPIFLDKYKGESKIFSSVELRRRISLSLGKV